MENKLLLCPVIIIIALSSCNTYRHIYSASPANNPYFTKKGETKIQKRQPVLICMEAWLSGNFLLKIMEQLK